MSFSYSQPTTSGWNNPVHAVRHKIDDTVETAQSVHDEEIALALAAHDSDPATQVLRASIDLAQTLHLRYAKHAATSKSVGDLSLSVDYSRTAGAYLGLIERLTGMLPGETGGEPAGRAFMIDTPRLFGIGQFDAGSGSLARFGR